MGAFKIIVGDVEDVLPQLEGPFDAVACDPPYGLEFMGKAWDRGVPGEQIWRLVSDLLRPGAFVAAFGGTRTFHRLACAIEDAGFEIRESLGWLYGSGFPKSLDVSKAIDRMDAREEQSARRYRFTAWVRSTGVTAKQIDEATGTNMGGHYTTAASQPAIMTREHLEACRHLLGEVPEWVEREADIRSVESENLKRRKVVGEREVPVGHAFAGATYGGDSSSQVVSITAPATGAARQWDGWGTALKPAWEPCVLAMKPLDGTFAANALEHGVAGLAVDASRIEAGESAGRWPANVALDEDAAAMLDQATRANTPGDSGGTSRFFYVAKVATAERNAGLEAGDPCRHPTLKPVKLAEWIAKLLLPPPREDGSPRRLLVPFSGAGSEVAGALRAGWDEVVGIERSEEYAAWSRKRIPALERLTFEAAARATAYLPGQALLFDA